MIAATMSPKRARWVHGAGSEYIVFAAVMVLDVPQGSIRISKWALRAARAAAKTKRMVSHEGVFFR